MTTWRLSGLRRPFACAVFLIVALAGADPATSQEGERRTLEIEDMFAFADVGSPRVSPDGEWVAYTVRRTNPEGEDPERSLWMVPSAGGEPVRMSAPGYSTSSPRWSPDGRYLSFLASRGEDAETQVWALRLDTGGEAQPLTAVEQGVRDYAWSPDGGRLALVLRDPEEDDADNDDESDDPEPYVIDRLQFKRDYVGYLVDDRRSHIYVYELGADDLRQVTSGGWDDEDPVWSPDGRLIAFVSNRTPNPDTNYNSDIWVVAADNTDEGAAARQVTTNPGPDGQPAWSPDGRWIAHVSNVRPDILWYGTYHLAVSPATGGEARLLTRELDRNVSSPRFSDDGEWVWFELEDSGADHLARIPLSGGAVDRPIAGDRVVRSWHTAGGVTAALIAEPQRTGEIVVKAGDGLRRLTSANDSLFASLRLGRVENIHFESEDGTEIEGWLYYPVGYEEGKRYPTILRIHGGPVAQYTSSFSFEPHLFAANGYAVVRTNPRGSSGYGQDFSHAIWADWGNKDFQDIMAGVDHAIELGVADPDRLGVGGWSYGGILTNYVITKTDRFEAAISGASEVLYTSNYGHDHYQRWWETELGLPWESQEVWDRISPFWDVENVTTPTLIMGGEEDWNVPILNSEQLYQALKRIGTAPTQLVVYPDEHHGISEPAFRIDRYQRYLAWYDEYVRGESATAATSGY